MKRQRTFSSNRSGNTKRRRVYKPKRRSTYRRQNPRTGGFLAMENKFYDTAVNAKAIVAAGSMAGLETDPLTYNCISAPAQGDGESNRDGKKIIINSVDVNGVILISQQINQTIADYGAKIMIALVQDTQTNGAQLNSEDVYTNPGTSAITCASPFRNLQYSTRFKVLAVHQVIIQPPPLAYDGTNMEQAGSFYDFRFNKKVNIPVTFTGTTEGVANVVDNSLHVISMASDVLLIPTLYYNARIRFKG